MLGTVQLGTLPAWGALVGALVAVVTIFVQRRHATRLSWEQGEFAARLGRVERTVAVHRDLTTGEVGAARDRLTEHLWRAGSRIEPGRCYQPTFAELLPDRFPSPDDAIGAGTLAEFPDDLATAGASPMRDLYKMLWCFERIDALLQSGQLDGSLAKDLVGQHAVWWELLCAQISDDDTMHRQALREVATALIAEEPKLADSARRNFAVHPL